jgi:predicted Zn finger-like uncharacterized protein
MPIEFSCPSCKLRYSVKDALAGKSAKCGKCGHRMQIPQAAATVANAASKVSPAKTASSGPAPAKSPPKEDDIGSWLDDDLEVAPPAIRSAAARPGATCPACGASLGEGAVLCVACGFDARTGAKHTTRHEIESTDASGGKKKKGRAKLGFAASLLRGTLLSFVGAMLGAVIWAGIAYLTSMELGYVAWGLGALAGFGMALGHDDDDGTFAGIIAAFMSLAGIVVAKVLIIVFVLAAIFANVAKQLDPVEMKRNELALNLTDEKLRAQGGNSEDADGEQWTKAYTEAKAEVAQLSEQELDARLEPYEKAEQAREAAALAQNEGDGRAGVDGQTPDGDADEADADSRNAADNLADGEGAGAIAALFLLMFRPVDGIFILLAFFTAYKVGSGTMTD